ncbi:DUF2690 domain-containing protein [Nonomuraea sp. NPDC000554]|uniref:DUF2690 domain-containing protein n=1 Tax=Nonomuraea sp. NPDC000554 TaxID=3154259 RepID=UPI003331129A
MKRTLAGSTGILLLCTGLLVGTSPAQAATGHDPYKSGCAATKRVVTSGELKVTSGQYKGSHYGDIKLMWSRKCQTNWTEIWVDKSDWGLVRVVLAKRNTDGKRIVDFNYGPGNGGHHWGDMISGRGICAWGFATAHRAKNLVARGTTPTHTSACG